MTNIDELFELYYRTEEDFWKEQNKVLPYAVNCQELKRIDKLVKLLRAEGFSFVPTLKGFPNQMTTFLVNLDFKKYYKIPFPVHCSCVNGRIYTIEEFVEEVFNRQVSLAG